MTEAVERIVNLAMLLAEARGPVTADRIRAEVSGYPADQDEDAFKRMFERDKAVLRDAGLVIESESGAETYRLDRSATFAGSFEMTPEEAATVRTAATALAADPSFPFSDDLRLALAKLSAEVEVARPSALARLADEDPETQGELVSRLERAAGARKRIRFAYTNSLGLSAPHEVEPYGLFLYDGRWYLVGRDVDLDEPRTYAVARMSDLDISPKSPKTAEFERPDGFDVASFVHLPFQYGRREDEVEAEIGFAPDVAWRAETVSRGRGRLEQRPEGAVWVIEARSSERLGRFVVENGPGLTLLAPPSAADALEAGLRKVVVDHA